MADSAITAFADAIATDLNAASWSETFTAARRFAPFVKVEDLSTLTVTIVPRGRTRTRMSRSQSQRDLQVDVAVQQRVDDINGDRPDALLALCEAIADHLDGATITADSTGYVIPTVETDPIYDPEHLRTRSVFTGVLTVTGRAVT